MSSNSPCAACKFQRRKCTPECIFSPYFPPEDPQKFVNVHKVFGGSNVSKILSDLSPSQREEAAKSLAFEAECRLRDPIFGCVGYISQLQQRLKQLHFDLANAKEELATYIGPSSSMPTFTQHAYNGGQMMYNSNVPQQQQQQIQQMAGNPSAALPYSNLVGAPAVVYGAGASQQQLPQMMVGANPASVLPYTNLMPSVVDPGSGAVIAPSQGVLQQQNGVVELDPQQYGAVVVNDQQAHELMRNYQLQQQQDYLVFKSSDDDQYEQQAVGVGQTVAGSSAPGFIQLAAAAVDDEIGAGPSLALGVNYENNPYNNNGHIQQQSDNNAHAHHNALQPQLILQQQHQVDQHLQTLVVLHQQESQEKAESDEGRSTEP